MPLKDLIHAIAMELVDQPDQVEVTEVPGDNNSVIELRVAKDDIGTSRLVAGAHPDARAGCVGAAG